MQMKVFAAHACSTPPPATEKNIYEMDAAERLEAGIESLPSSLEEAINEMKNNAFVEEILGKHIFTKYIEAKTQEWEDYKTKVTQWEIDQYLTKF